MAGRPYDLRHAAVSLWLNGGVSPTEIAKPAGHSVEVLLRVYAKCVHGQEEIANKRIEEILNVSMPDNRADTEQQGGGALPPRVVDKARSRDDAESVARLLRSARANARGHQRER